MYKPCVILFIFSLLATLGIISSCYDENNTFGDKLVSSSFRNVLIDTSTVLVTTVSIDSLETSGQSVALAGQYTHPLWGTMSASAFIPYNRPTYNVDGDEVVTLDSLILILKPNGFFVGDTTQPLTFSIHLLKEKIILNDNGYLYNNSTVAYDPDPLGTYTFKPRPNDTTRLIIRLADTLGIDLLNRFHTRDQAVSADRYEDYFRGIVIIPDNPENQSLLGFAIGDTAAAISLCYRIADELENSHELLFTPRTDTHFNNIAQDRTGTLMEGYTTKNAEIPSAVLDNKGVLMCGVGWYTRLEFPYLNNLREQGEQVEIQQAYLKIYPIVGTYSDYNALPDSIYLYIADENNVVTDAVKDYLGEEVQSGGIVKDDTYNENTYYYFDVTDFMKEELGASGKYKHNLQLVFNSNSYTQTVKNLTIGDQNSKKPVVLQISYKIYESY